MMKPSAKKKEHKKKVARYSNEDLQQALIDIRKKGKKVRETCLKYGIPKTTIQDRLSGKMCDAIQPRGPDPILGIDGEKRVKDWLLTIAHCGFPIKKEELLDTVQKIIKDFEIKNPFKGDRPGRSWYVKFLKRHPDIARLEGVNKAKAPVTVQSIRTWFNKLATFLTEDNNQDILTCPERIFKVDECSFSLCPKSGEVLSPRRFKNVRQRQVKSNFEKNNLSVLVTVNAIAQVSPPLVVFPYLRPPQAVVDSMPEYWCLGKSETGFVSTNTFFEYITNDFINWVDRNCIQKPILLLVDSQKSHMSLDLSTMCENLGIILYALPPNTSHIFQAANVSVFEPLKSLWPTVVRNFLSKPENVNSCLSKSNICQLFRDVLGDASLDSNIKRGFRQCGLFPFDPNAVYYNDGEQDTTVIPSKCEQDSPDIVSPCEQDTPVASSCEQDTPVASPCEQNTPVIASPCEQNTVTTTSRSNGHSSASQEITNDDIASTRKVLKHIRARLKAKLRNVDNILEELCELETGTIKQEKDSETTPNDSLGNFSSIEMELAEWHQDQDF